MTFKAKISKKQFPEPYWHRLLRHFERKGYIHNGLTIPFLIGSRSIIYPGEPLITIEELLSEAAEYGAILQKCAEIGEFVMGAMNSDTRQAQCNHHDMGCIYLADGSLDHVTNAEDKIKLIQKIYYRYVVYGQFSKNNGLWTSFSAEDEARIKEAFL
ncbi:hypothetical protein [Paraflavitalea pollutisoli]|uniref:hypothetical protein n=1 Tax=Paraflavitalea pollutisoli TaxID=3034143 RepID=UPI0023EC00FC|nr:hypothetical protein [Paraflavitalea sp. H1-2-19X]